MATVAEIDVVRNQGMLAVTKAGKDSMEEAYTLTPEYWPSEQMSAFRAPEL